MASSSNKPSFLTFHGKKKKKYHPSLEWNDEEELLQDPKTHAPYSNMDFKESFFFFFIGKFVDFMLYCKFGVETLSFCYGLLLLKFWTLHG